MTHFTTIRIRGACVIACLCGLLFAASTSYAQAAPDFGTASTYVIFTGSGAINNTGASYLVGDVGQDGAYAFNGFPPGQYTGTLNRNNGASAQAKSDLLTAWTTEAAVACDYVLGVGIVDGQSFDPAVYCTGAASTTTGNITFNAHGNANAIFIVKIGGQLDANAGTHILLANGAKSSNIYWFVDGAVTIADNSTFKGTIFARGAISFAGTSTLDGRALIAPGGAITLSANVMGLPVDTLIVLTPAAGDTIRGGTENYAITWSGSGIALRKIFALSLDSGLTWRTIDTISADVLTHNWNVPDTVSTKAVIRITDSNGRTANSGVFTISSSKIIVTNPALAAMITGGTQNYQITWTGTGLTSRKIFEYSLDSGLTWRTIDTMNGDGFTHSWNVPDTVSTRAVVRITDSLGITGKSGVFTIKSSRITVTQPALAAVITGGTQNYQITWTGLGLTSRKIFAYSLDSGLTWRTIDTMNGDGFTHSWNLPDTVSTRAIVRITDSLGITGNSGVFTIKSSKIIITHPALAAVITGGTQNYQITWTGTGLTPRKTFEYSLDSGLTWTSIGIISADVFTYSWNVPDTVSTRAVVRITDSIGITGKSGVFMIKSSKIIITHPVLAAVITGGTQNYQITWTGTGLTSRKIFAYSLDSGLTWRTIDTMNGDGFTHSWNLPDTVSTRAVVRITDSLGITGKSGVFTIKSSKIIVTNPALAAKITGGTQNYQITWTGLGLTSKKTFDYSLDSGLTWTTIGSISADVFTYNWNVPDTVSTRAVVRITDSLGITGRSGVFMIKSSKIIVLRPTLAEMVKGGTQNYQITWTGTGLTPRKTFAYSLDSGLSWILIGTISADVFTYCWNVPDTVSTRAVVRITDSTGITGKSGVFTITSSKIIVTHPAAGEILASSTLGYQVTWTGTGLTTRKTFELSLDGGLTWRIVGSLTADALNYYWNVPDTASTQAVIRITDTNGISGRSGVFTIQSSKTLLVVHPALGEVVAAAMPNFQITWTGTGLTSQKSFELSLDGGLTWTPIGTITADVYTYSWDVPDTVSSQAVIRITNNNGTTSVSGESGVFSIRRNAGTITVIHPLAGEILDGGYVNFPVTFTGTNITALKTFEYSLNGGATWTLIGIANSEAETYAWGSVPNVATTHALLRIRDANGVIGISGLFTISVTPNIGTINEVTLSGLDYKQNIANNRQLGITWTYTPNIGTSVEVEYSLDYMVTWHHIATVLVSESPNSTVWMTPMTAYYNPVFIRVTSSLGMSRLSSAFSIGSSASVSSEASKNGYSVSNYPNPVSGPTMIHFVLPVRSDVTLTVTDNLGRQVNAMSQTFEAGMHDIPFNAEQLADGVYLYTLAAGTTRICGRMTVIR